MKNLFSAILAVALLSLVSLSTSSDSNPFQAEATSSFELATADISLDMDERNVTTLSISSGGTASAIISSSSGGVQTTTITGSGGPTTTTTFGSTSSTTGGVGICDLVTDPILRARFGCDG